MSAHTPGPWKANFSKFKGAVIAWHVTDSLCGSTNAIAVSDEYMGPLRTSDELEANARLIEAAPALLAALKSLAFRIDYYAELGKSGKPNIEDWAYTAGSSDMKAARAAIAKATGAV